MCWVFTLQIITCQRKSKMFSVKKMFPNYFIQTKRTVSVISSDPPSKDDKIQVTTKSLKAVSFSFAVSLQK